jgi:hypothetical protein
MAAAATENDTSSTEETAPKPTVSAPSLVADDSGRHGLVVGADEDGTPLICWLPPAAAYGLDVTKVG